MGMIGTFTPSHTLWTDRSGCRPVSRSAASARPESRSTMRLPPSRLRSSTMPGCSAVTRPMTAGLRRGRMAAHDFQQRLGRRGRHDRRSCAPRWPRRADRAPATRRPRPPARVTGMAASSSSMPTPASRAISFSAAARPPRVRSRRQCKSPPARQHGFHQAGQRGAIALQGRLEAQPLADRHDGHAVPAQVAAEEHDVAGGHAPGRDVDARRHQADARRVDENAVPLAAIHHLGVAGDDLHAGLRGPPPPSRPPRGGAFPSAGPLPG